MMIIHERSDHWSEGYVGKGTPQVATNNYDYIE